MKRKSDVKKRQLVRYVTDVGSPYCSSVVNGRKKTKYGMKRKSDVKKRHLYRLLQHIPVNYRPNSLLLREQETVGIVTMEQQRRRSKPSIFQIYAVSSGISRWAPEYCPASIPYIPVYSWISIDFQDFTSRISIDPAMMGQRDNANTQTALWPILFDSSYRTSAVPVKSAVRVYGAAAVPLQTIHFVCVLFLLASRFTYGIRTHGYFICCNTPSTGTAA